jgi:hypothetical protein
MNAFITELRFPREEVFERLAQLDDGHLRGIFGDFAHPRELSALDGVQPATQRSLRGLGRPSSLRAIRSVPSLGGTGKVGRLHVVRIKSDLVSDDHEASSKAFFTPASSFWVLRLREPSSRALNTVMISSTFFRDVAHNIHESARIRN